MTSIIDIMSEWYEFYQPVGASKFDKIISGMRSSVPTSGTDVFPGGKKEKVSKSQRQTGSCQYWIKGLSAPCINWDGKNAKCKVITIFPDLPPTGYGLGGCDQLGRRDWCSKYKRMKDDDLEQFVCIAPCMEKSGLGKQIKSVDKFLSYRPLKISEIKGYNSDGSDAEVGQCDEWGMGRGKDGMGLDLLELIYDKLPICRQYKPFQMGFGAIQPRPFHGSDRPGKPFNPVVNYIPTTDAKLYDGSKSDPLIKMEVILPFTFQIYNSRAMYQKCAYWENIYPGFFNIDHVGSDPSMFNIVMGDGQSYCKCTDSSCDPYKNMVGNWPKGVPWILLEVWAEYEGIVCNGAKPECPCYTGKWIYCNDNNMRDGMRITADQIFELRFWTSNWESQKEYDEFYLLKPGTGVDISTADVYTFTRWNVIDPLDPNKSEMKGKKHHMCMPAPLNMREFIVKTYITKTDFNYPLLGQSLGTQSEATFPTLLRELKDSTDFVPDIQVIYPYSTIDPWSLLACDDSNKPNYCFHDSNLMSDPLISFIGSTALNKKIYVLNSSISKIGISSAIHIDKYKRASEVPKNMWETVCKSIEQDIKDFDREGSAIFYSASNKYGFFEVSRVKLKLNEMNNLYIMCNFTTGNYKEYSFRKVNVKSRYWAGLIEQNTGIHTHDGETWFNFFPIFFYPGVNDVTGSVQIVNPDGKVQSIISTYALYVYGIYVDIAYYSYCINEYSKKDYNVVKWTQVGATGYIWAEIDDIEISYLWNFAVTSATMKNKKASLDPLKPNNFFCGSPADNVTLEVIYPDKIQFIGISIDRNSEILRRSIPPNAILLKAPRPMPFFNSEWTLKIEYSYQRLDTFMGDGSTSKVVWPYDMGVEWSYNQWKPSPFQVIIQAHNKFLIPEVGTIKTRGTMKIMAFIEDKNKRIQAGVSTKLLLQGYNGGCRSVEINYKYLANATGFNLEPNSGFFTWIGSPKVVSLSEPLTHGKYAKCGDHECAPNNCIGPVWFPFNNCTTFDYYDNVSNANYCMLPISEARSNISKMGKAGWRYVVADEFNAWISTGGNWAASCGSPWSYHYSRATGQQRFVGVAKKKAKVDALYYAFIGWVLPPFGNTGRGFIERYITRDLTSYIDRSGSIPVPQFCYMPMVFDKEDLFPDLNPFANPDEATPLHEPFSHFSMMSNYILSNVSETVSTARYNFDEIIEPIHHGNCMYPYPLMKSVGGGYRVIRYGFKNPNHVWAWPEFWKPLERNISKKEKFNFLELIRPEYYFDYNKVEHRLITDEGYHTIIFEPPVSKKEITKTSTDQENFPSISLDTNFPRYFKLLYDDYTQENVEWRDESISGKSGSSGGNSIYEIANNGAGLNGLYVNTKGTQWLHDFNTLFDNNSSPDPNEDRKAYLGKSSITGEDVYLYYNRGLIVFLPRNRLKYLPLKISLIGDYTAINGSLNDKELNSLIYYYDLIKLCVERGAPVTIIIKGYWGIKISPNGKTTTIYSKPGIEVIEGINPIKDFDKDGFPIWPENSILVDSLTPRSGKYYVPNKYDYYTIKFELPTNPERIVSIFSYFMFRIFAAPGSEILDIESISVDYGKYVRSEEQINVWEKKYYISECKLNNQENADGPDTNLYRTYDRSQVNAGQYFPFTDMFDTIMDHKDGKFLDGGVTDFEDSGKVVSKLNMVGFTKVFREDEEISVSMGNLKTIELEPQKELYNEAFDLDKNDDLNFDGFKHPAVEEWLKTININIIKPQPMKLSYKKIDWDHNNISRLLNQDGDFISPGGHFYKWGTKFTKQRCYLFGGVQNVYEAKYVHHKHGSGGVDSESDALPTGAAYAGRGRLWYYESKLVLLKNLGQSETGMDNDALTGAKNATPKRS